MSEQQGTTKFCMDCKWCRPVSPIWGALFIPVFGWLVFAAVEIYYWSKPRGYIGAKCGHPATGIAVPRKEGDYVTGEIPRNNLIDCADARSQLPCGPGALLFDPKRIVIREGTLKKNVNEPPMTDRPPPPHSQMTTSSATTVQEAYEQLLGERGVCILCGCRAKGFMDMDLHVRNEHTRIGRP